MRRFAQFLTLFMVAVLSAHAVPAVLNYAGQVAVNGQPFDGQGLFKFALVNADGNASYWSNDGTSANGSEPAAHVSIPVNGGLYSLLLGNTAMSGMGSIDPQVFAQNTDAKLRVWFSDGVNGFQQLSPDRPFASVPYAFSAENAKSANTAKTVEAGAITPQMIQSSSITTAQLNEQILKYLKPEITTHPQAPGLIFSGQSMNLTSQAEGKFLTYQWQRNGQPIAGATGPSFNIAEVNGSLHDGNYSVVVSNDFGLVTSTPTSLQVDGTPSAHTVASIGMEMIFCPPGTFTMGSPTSEAGRQSDETQHQVTLTNGFYLGKYEVTQAQYQTVMNGNSAGLNADPSQFKGSNRPVEQVSWEDAQIFLTRLNVIEQSAGRLPNGWKYVLPTEAEWEYACRAGTTTAYSWGDDINSSLANYNWDGVHNDGNDSQQTVNIGQFSANPWGFYDMHGNVWEWVHDWKTNYLTGAQTDPEGPASGSRRVIRGGSWYDVGSWLRSANRQPEAPSDRHNTIGFRVGFQAVKPDGANPELELFGGAGITREAGQAWAEPGAAGHDARDGNITSSITVTGTVDMNTTGTYVLTYSVADAAGNTDTATRSVTVVDTTAPALTLLGDANMTHAENTAWVDPGATASDSLDGNLTSSITITGTVDFNITGVYTLTYSVTDGASNETNATRTVNVLKAHSVDLNASVKLDMLWVEPGTFTMGSPTTEAGRGTNETEHNVTLTQGFYLGKYEVTQAQYEAVMTGNGDGLSATPSQYSGNPNRPVEKVSWNDIQIFLSRLNAQQSANIPAGWAYVLPTEAQWEYACRAGTTTAYSWGNDINSTRANYSVSGLSQTRDVGYYAANPWGFFDMHGNVWEWTADWYQAAYPTGYPAVDPTGPASGSDRVRRGGAWGGAGATLRSAERFLNTPSYRDSHLGFRVGFQFTGTHSVDLNASVKLDMLWVEPGTFTMGSPISEAGRGIDETEHNVTLTQGFYLGRYEVTQAQYEAVMTGNSDGLSATPSQYSGNPNRPVEKVSWDDIQIFLSRLNAQQSANVHAGWAYVLPTESQWEYACRAGTTTAYSWGNDINATRANYSVSGLSQTRDVGYYAANPLGFFDMHGNVWEWTADWYGATYPTGNPVVDPTGEASGSDRVLRGGSWWHDGTVLRSAKRYSGTSSTRNIHRGFRVGFQQQ